MLDTETIVFSTNENNSDPYIFINVKHFNGRPYRFFFVL